MSSTSDLTVVSYISDEHDLSGRVDSRGRAACKFVLLEHRSSPVLVYGLYDDFDYHAQLVHRFCEENEIAGYWVKKPDMLEVVDTDCTVVGGGWLMLEPKAGLARYSGYSTAYGPVPSGLRERLLDGLTLPSGLRCQSDN